MPEYAVAGTIFIEIPIQFTIEANSQKAADKKVENLADELKNSLSISAEPLPDAKIKGFEHEVATITEVDLEDAEES